MVVLTIISRVLFSLIMYQGSKLVLFLYSGYLYDVSTSSSVPINIDISFDKLNLSLLICCVC